MLEVFEYAGTHTRFYTKAGILIDPRIKIKLTSLGIVSTREEAVELIWKDQKKPGGVK